MLIVALLTLALLGVLESLGALVGPPPVDAIWCDAAGDDGGEDSTGSRPCGPAALDRAPPSAPPGEPSRRLVGDVSVPASGTRLLSRESRAPPALLAPASR